MEAKEQVKPAGASRREFIGGMAAVSGLAAAGGCRSLSGEASFYGPTIRDLKGAIQSALSASGENFASRARSGGNGRPCKCERSDGVAAEPRDDG
ncbi:MAG: hypothetical protein IJG13_20585, partial [Kiritimatiellae bacterium]|nr:hypothetical protein [Kiritimatiellia bacterium]